MLRRANFFVLLLGVFFVCLIVGCRPAGPTRFEVSGEVFFDGTPVEDGSITFTPQDGQATSDGSNIIKGEYRIPKEKGLLPGKYKVSITAGDGISGAGDAGVKAGPRPKVPPGATPGVERVPPEWNTKTQQIVEVKAEGPNKFDFNIPRPKS
jgi:hypothetical protein